MPEALNVLWWSARTWIRNLIPLTLLSMVWAGLGATVVLFPFVTAGLFVVANRIVYGKPARLRDFVAGGRRYWWQGTQWVITNGVAGLVISVIVYAWPVKVELNEWIALLAALSTLIWFALQFYFWPLMLETTQKQYSTVLFSMLMLLMAAPIYTLTLLAASGTLMWITLQTVWPVGLWVVSYVAGVANRAVIERLEQYGGEPDERRLWR